MKTLKNDDTKLPGFLAAKDAKKHHIIHWPEHTTAKQQIATELKDLAAVAHFRSRVFMTARKNFIAIKVDMPQAADRLQNEKEFAELDDFVSKNGIVSVKTKHNILYRVPK